MSETTTHIVNGSVAGEQLEAAGVGGRWLAWDDVLHEGPVPADLDLHQLSRVRAQFVHNCGWASLAGAQARFAQRDRKFEAAAEAGEVIIWSTFELYDQLHLLQLLDWFEKRRYTAKRPTLIFIWDYFSELSAEDIHGEMETRTPATEAQVELAAALWAAFRNPLPTMLGDWMERATSELPFMHKALVRLCEEYPSVRNGLTRTQSQIMQILHLGPESPERLFRANQQLESQAFMGDSSFWRQVGALSEGDKPAVHVLGQARFQYPTQFAANDDAFSRQVLELTDFGRAVVHADADFFAANPRELSIGGVTLGPDNDWRWDAEESRLLPVG